MPLGPGKYDDLCTLVRERANAEGAAVIIMNGDRGAGFSVQGSLPVLPSLVDVLEHMARQMRESMREPGL